MVDLGGSTYYIFLNARRAPFNNQLAREAVVTGLNQPAMSTARGRARSCRPATSCRRRCRSPEPRDQLPVRQPGHGGNMAKAKALLKQSGMAGSSVTVWSEERFRDSSG